MQFEEALLKLKEYEDKIREAEEAAKQNSSIEAATAIAMTVIGKPLVPKAPGFLIHKNYE